ncbi:MAG: hypothetical protein V2A73_22035, partial [Pseudomonadota bacterium]
MTPRASATVLAVLSKLSPTERTIIELGSAFSAAEPLSIFTRGLGMLHCRLDGHSVKNSDVLPVLRGLVEQGLLAGECSYFVPPEIAHAAMLEVARNGRLARLAEIVREIRPARKEPGRTISTWDLAKRELRLELYAGRWTAARSLVGELRRHIFFDICQPFDPAWVARFPVDLRRAAVTGIVETSLALLKPADQAFALLEAEPPSELTDSEHRVIVEQLIFRGRLADAERLLAARTSVESEVSRAFLLFLRGQFGPAIAAYEAALVSYFKIAGKRAVFFPDRAGFFFLVALIAEGSTASLSRAADLAGAGSRAKSLPFRGSHSLFSEVLGILTRRIDPDDVIYLANGSNLAALDPLEVLLHAATLLWVEVGEAERSGAAKSVFAAVAEQLAAAQAAGLGWYATQAAAVLQRHSGAAMDKGTAVDGISLAHLVAPREHWSDALDALLEI